MVRVAAQELLDPVRLPVGEPEGAVERLIGDLAQVIQSSRGSGGLPAPRRSMKQSAARVRYKEA